MSERNRGRPSVSRGAERIEARREHRMRVARGSSAGPWIIAMVRACPLSGAHTGSLVHAMTPNIEGMPDIHFLPSGRQSNGYRVTLVCTLVQSPGHAPPRFRDNESDTDTTTLATTRSLDHFHFEFRLGISCRGPFRRSRYLRQAC